jgi:hypothetical protein
LPVTPSRIFTGTRAGDIPHPGILPVAFVGEDKEMVLPRDSFHTQVQSTVLESWQQLVGSMEESLNLLEKGLDEASEMRQICTDEWCVATEHVLDELSNGLFSISEPRWASEEDAKKLRALKRRVHDLYAKYKAVSKR